MSRSGAGRRSLEGLLALVATAALAVALWQLAPLLRDGQPGSSPSPTPSPTPTVDLSGPLNLLLVGVDTRVSQPDWEPKADAVLVMHIPADHDRAFLFSLPRDLLVDVPAFEPAGFGGEFTKLTHAMAHGSRVPGESTADPAQGLDLLTRTVSGRIGIEEFDAAAVLTFGGFSDLVDAVGGIDVHLDLQVVSLHREPDGTHRELQPGGNGYIGPQMVYEVGDHHLEGWQALDVARQRNLDGGDYGRQRHHRLLVRALVRHLFAAEMVSDPARIAQVRDALGDSLVYSGRGSVTNFAAALGELTADQIVTVGLPGESVISDAGYQGEQLLPVSEDFLAAVSDGEVEGFLADHPDLLDDTA